MNELILQNEIKSKIYSVRGKEVMLDSDLAELYEVETRILNQAVKRNIERFPDDFMFQLSKEEYENLKSQFVISSSKKHGGVRKMPYVFTEQGLYMLATVLRSKVATEVNISIIRTFTKLREFSMRYNALARQIMELERKHNKKFKEVFARLDSIVEEIQKTDKKIMGFIRD